MKKLIPALALAAAAGCALFSSSKPAPKEKPLETRYDVAFAPETYALNFPKKGLREACAISYVTNDFGGQLRPAICLEVPWTEKGRIDISPAFNDIDMLDKYPTIDYRISVSQPSAKIEGRYHGNVFVWDSMTERFHFDENGLCRIRREIGHNPNWASWCDVRKVRGMNVSFNTDSWTNKAEKLRICVSDIRFASDDSWKGTERDAAFRAWTAFCDAYEPDLSDSSKFLEPPAEGRLAKPLKLVENHVAKAEIVAPKDYYNSLELAARDLQHWIEKMTGARLPIVEEPTGKMPVRIFLNDPAAQKRWADDVAWLKGGKDCDGWFVHTVGNDIHVGCAVPNDANWERMKDLGLPYDACPVGVFRGVIALLENNSTILFASKDKLLGTVYDETPDFTVTWGEGRSRPATCGRGWLVGNDTSNKNKIPLDSLCMWCARTGGNNRMPHRISGHGNQSGEEIEYVPHTEPYQVFDGEKRIKHGYYSGQICLGAPDVLDLCISNGVEKVRRSREAGYPVVSIGFWNEDNWRVCVCDKCTEPIEGDDGTVLKSCKKTNKDKMAGGGAEQVYRSTQYMQFVNRMADGIAAKCPGVKTEILAYLFQRPTPKCAISPNVAWTYCPYHFRWSDTTPVYHPCNHHVYANFTSMLEKGGEMHVYDYHAFSGINRHRSPEAVAEDYRWYAAHGIKNTGAEFAYVDNPRNPVGMMNGWLFNKVGWDADIRKVEELRKYFIRRLYREGAPAAEDYYARLRKLEIRSSPPGQPRPQATSADEAKEVFGKYLGKITNPIAREHYEILMDIATGVARKKDFKAVDYGVVAGGTNECSAAIQKAIDAAAAAGGGRVVLPTGKIRSNSIRLKSHVNLFLPRGCELVVGDRVEDYFDFPTDVCSVRPESSSRVFIYAWDAEDIAITGEGTVEGQGPKFFDDAKKEKGARFWPKPPWPRPRMVQFVRCRKVRLSGVTFKDSPGWTMLIRLCENVQASGIKVLADQRMINSDGIDFDGCRRVRVSGCTFKTGDDCLILRAMREKPGDHVVCEDVIVTDCTLDSACQTIRLGCPSDDTIRHARFSNIRGRGYNGVKLECPVRYLRPDDEGYLDISDIVIDGYTGTFEGAPVQVFVEGGVKVRNVSDITFRNFDVTGKLPVLLRGNADSPLRNVRLADCKVTVRAKGVEPLDLQATEPLVLERCVLNGKPVADEKRVTPRGERVPLVRVEKTSWETQKQTK